MIVLNPSIRSPAPFESTYNKARLLLIANPAVASGIIFKALRFGKITSSCGGTCWPPTSLAKEQTVSDKTTIGYFCPECARALYHTDLFNLSWVTKCPIHNQPLVQHCPDCARSPTNLQQAKQNDCKCCGAYLQFDTVSGLPTLADEEIEEAFCPLSNLAKKFSTKPSCFISFDGYPSTQPEWASKFVGFNGCTVDNPGSGTLIELSANHVFTPSLLCGLYEEAGTVLGGVRDDFIEFKVFDTEVTPFDQAVTSLNVDKRRAIERKVIVMVLGKKLVKVAEQSSVSATNCCPHEEEVYTAHVFSDTDVYHMAYAIWQDVINQENDEQSEIPCSELYRKILGCNPPRKPLLREWLFIKTANHNNQPSSTVDTTYPEFMTYRLSVWFSEALLEIELQLLFFNIVNFVVHLKGLARNKRTSCSVAMRITSSDKYYYPNFAKIMPFLLRHNENSVRAVIPREVAELDLLLAEIDQKHDQSECEDERIFYIGPLQPSTKSQLLYDRWLSNKDTPV